jgi:hypothetical protein
LGWPSVWLEDAVRLLSEGLYEWSYTSEDDEGYLDVYTSDGVYGLPVTQNKLNGDVLELLILAAPPRNRSRPLGKFCGYASIHTRWMLLSRATETSS